MSAFQRITHMIGHHSSSADDRLRAHLANAIARLRPIAESRGPLDSNFVANVLLLVRVELERAAAELTRIPPAPPTNALEVWQS